MISESKKINPNGCGIGLTVSKKYVEKLGGQISLKSKWGTGTSIRFTVELNLPFSKSSADIGYINERIMPSEVVGESEL
jgi:signal transduction histidine kinase